MRKTLLMALVLFTVPAAGTAGGGPEAIDVVHHIFEVADRDEDGSLTRAEYEGAGLQRFGVSFDESDTDADGSTSLAEYVELYRRHHPSADGGNI